MVGPVKNNAAPCRIQPVAQQGEAKEVVAVFRSNVRIGDPNRTQNVYSLLGPSRSTCSAKRKSAALWLPGGGGQRLRVAAKHHDAKREKKRSGNHTGNQGAEGERLRRFPLVKARLLRLRLRLADAGRLHFAWRGHRGT